MGNKKSNCKMKLQIKYGHYIVQIKEGLDLEQ